MKKMNLIRRNLNGMVKCGHALYYAALIYSQAGLIPHGLPCGIIPFIAFC
jgi:hypothetical protein